jgi:hypothetical protein
MARAMLRGARRTSAAHFVEQTVKKLVIGLVAAFALPAFARPPTERPVVHKEPAVERANERKAANDAAVVKGKMIEHTKINQH